MQTIVVGYIDTPEGHAALERAVEEARLRRAKLVILRSSRGDKDDDEVVEDYVSTHEELERIQKRLDEEEIIHETRQRVRGAPAGEDLAAFANEQKADLVVIGVRRRSAVGKAVLGSNAHDIIMRSECPVLSVKASK